MCGLEESLSGPTPYHVQVVDFKTHVGSIKPFTVYTIVAHQRDKGKREDKREGKVREGGGEGEREKEKDANKYCTM